MKKEQIVLLRIITYLCALLFLFAIGAGVMSGNDKYPYIILLIWGGNLVLFVINLVMFLQNRMGSGKRSNLILSLFMASYVPVVIFFSRMGWVDSMSFLGFR